MSTLMGRGPKDSYQELLKVSTAGGVGDEASVVTDGKGEATPLALSKEKVSLNGVAWPVDTPDAGAHMRVSEDGKALEWCVPTKQAELILKANFVGQVTETIGSSRFYPPSDIVINKVYCSISSPGTASNEFDVKVNGSSIFPVTKPSIAPNQYRSVDYPVNQPVPKTSYITVDVTRASGSDLVVYIVYS